MADGEGKDDRAAGPWDVAIYLLQRFPTFALVALLVGGAFYGFLDPHAVGASPGAS